MRRLSLVLLLSLPGIALGQAVQRGPHSAFRPAHGAISAWDTSVVTSIPFGTAGCWASGTAMGARGETVSSTRALTRICPIAAGEVTCQANEFCVTEKGLLAERLKVQLHPTPEAPDAGTVTFTATGAHTFSIPPGGGSGSQALSASGTLVATGLPCTASLGSPCNFTITTLGATPTGTLAAVTGSLTRAQIEAAPYPSSFIPSGTRNADAPIITDYLGAGPLCVVATYEPENGRTWNAVSEAVLTSMGVLGGANSWYLAAQNPVMVNSTWDLTAASTTGTYTHSLLPGVPYRLAATMNTASPTVRVANTTASPYSLSGAGTSLFSALPSSVRIGHRSTGNAFDGYIRNFCIARYGNCAACYTGTLSVHWASDSIFSNSIIWDGAAGFSNTLAAVTHTSAAFGGTWSGSGLLEVADQVWAPTAGWVQQARGAPYANILVLQYGANDSGLTTGYTVDSFRRTYDTIVSRAHGKYGHIITNTPTPHCDAGRTAWDGAADVIETSGIRAAVNTVAAKYGTLHNDIWTLFQSLAPSGGYTIAQLNADTIHPANPYGQREIARVVGPKFVTTDTYADATPEISGQVVTYLWGAVASGSWTLTSEAGIVSQNLLGRIANLGNSANVASAIGAAVTFPNCTGSMVWAHFAVDSASAGTATVYVDKGTAGEIARSINTLAAGVTEYPRAFPIADGLSAGAHTVEIDVTSNAPVRVIGISCVGAT